MILTAGKMEAQVDPERGGSLRALTWAGRPVLRTAAPEATDPLDMGCFPLVPYANRIADARFDLDGCEYRLRHNFGDHPHSLHGVGWQRAWQVTAQDAGSAVLELTHDGDADWPFPFRARQSITLASDHAVLGLSVTNADRVARPAGLGFHPYFAIDPDCRVRFAADKVLLASDDMLPVGQAAADHFGDWRHGERISGDTLIDNAYAGWDGTAWLDHGDGMAVRIEAPDCKWLHLYRPPGEGFACLEPVTHGPDAINRSGGMPMLQPGESREIAMRIAVLPDG